MTDRDLLRRAVRIVARSENSLMSREGQDFLADARKVLAEPADLELAYECLRLIVLDEYPSPSVAEIVDTWGRHAPGVTHQQAEAAMRYEAQRPDEASLTAGEEE